jgi:hypothetical protein
VGRGIGSRAATSDGVIQQHHAGDLPQVVARVGIQSHQCSDTDPRDLRGATPRVGSDRVGLGGLSPQHRAFPPGQPAHLANPSVGADLAECPTRPAGSYKCLRLGIGAQRRRRLVADSSSMAQWMPPPGIVLRIDPNLCDAARADRGFLVRAVRHLVGVQGIRQRCAVTPRPTCRPRCSPQAANRVSSSSPAAAHSTTKPGSTPTTSSPTPSPH